MATAVKQRTEYRTYRRVGYTAYDGSAARQLERGAEVLQPRPQVRPRERTAVRPRVQVREAGKVSVFAVAGFLAVGLLAVVLLLSYVKLMVVSDQVVDLRNELTTLQSEEAKLRAQYELAYDLNSIEEQVTASGSMVSPQHGQVFYVDLSEPDSVEFFQQGNGSTGLSGAADSIRSIGSRILEYFR